MLCPLFLKYPFKLKIIYKKINQITTEETIPTMWDDGFASSHPLKVKVLTRAEIISSAFDQITTRKGAAVMKMVESVVGATQFQNGLKVKKNLYFYLLLLFCFFFLLELFIHE